MIKRYTKGIVAALCAFSLLTGCSQVSKQENKEVKVETKAAKEVKEANSNIPSTFQKVVKMFDNIREFKIPYWGGYSLKDKQILVFSDDEEKAIVWNSKGTGKTKVIDKSQVSEEKTLSDYSDGQYDGVDTIFIRHSGSDDEAFAFAVHEGYHFYGQKWINDMNIASYIPRGTVYPENVEARYLYNEAGNRVKEYMNGGNDKGISEALSYYKKLVKSYNEDVEGNLSSALAEGTANYVEHLYMAAAKDVSLQKNMKALNKLAWELNKKNFNSDMQMKSGEYYYIASAPLFYLGMQGEDATFEELKQGIHPLALLDKVTSPVEATDNEKLKNTVENYYASKNQELEGKMTELESMRNSKDYVKVYIPQSAFPGSIEFGEFINFKENGEFKTLDERVVVEGYLNNGAVINLKGQDALESDDYQNFIVYLKKDQLKIKKGKLTIDLPTITIKDCPVEVQGDVYQLKID